MNTSRQLISRLPVLTRKTLFKPSAIPARKMSFWSAEPASFSPLFRLLDDFDNYNRSQRPSRTHVKAFQPKFDVRELPEAYELHGELPGVDQKNVEIEFTDPQVLAIRGRVERSYTSGTPPQALEEPKASGAIAEDAHKDHQPTVEDAPEDGKETKTNEEQQAVTTSQNKETQVTKPEAPLHKYWVSERSVGEFARSFSFPVPVDQDAVSASMKDGILSITVPKAKAKASRKITIN